MLELGEEKGLICLKKARKAVRMTCPRARDEEREELISQLMPGLWRRVRHWRPGAKSLDEYAEAAAFQSLKDSIHARRSSCDLLDRRAATLEDLRGLY